MNIANLKFPPLKCYQPTSFPNKLIYKSYANYFGHKVDQFIMFSTKKGSDDHAIMKCFPELITREGKRNIPSLYVWFLSSNCSGKGFGTEMLDFAINYSKKIGCKGNLHLTSDVSFMPNRIPHIFYRKFGMSTKKPSIDRKLDSFIAKKKNATYKDFDTIEMFYPPIEHKKDKLRNLIYKGLKFGLNKLFGSNS